MEGPTPVSALIHAAHHGDGRCVHVARSNWIFQMAPQAMGVVAVIGALTALLPHPLPLFKTISSGWLAYSTVSRSAICFWRWELGVSAVVFHLMTHAFFKSPVVLGSGSVIHAMHHEQDMRKMGA